MVESDNLRAIRRWPSTMAPVLSPLSRLWHADSRPRGLAGPRPGRRLGGRRISPARRFSRYRNEKEVGEAMQEGFQGRGRSSGRTCLSPRNSGITIIVPERVKPAFRGQSQETPARLRGSLYLIHTPFAFQPGDEQDPRDANSSVVYDEGGGGGGRCWIHGGRWRGLVDEGRCKAIGLSDISLAQTQEIFRSGEDQACRRSRRRSHPYLPPMGPSGLLQEGNGIVLQPFAAARGIVASPSCWKILSLPLSPRESARPRR